MSEGDGGAGGVGGADGVFTIWFIPGISAIRRWSDLEPDEAGAVDPDAAAVTREDPSEAVCEVIAVGALRGGGAAEGVPDASGESTVLLLCKALPEAGTGAELPSSGDWLVDAVLSAGMITDNEGVTESDGAVAGAVTVASAGLRISLCGTRL